MIFLVRQTVIQSNLSADEAILETTVEHDSSGDVVYHVKHTYFKADLEAAKETHLSQGRKAAETYKAHYTNSQWVL